LTGQSENYFGADQSNMVDQSQNYLV